MISIPVSCSSFIENPRCKGLLRVSVFQALVIMISFSSLIVAVIVLSQKSKPPLSLQAIGGLPF
ncbi:putative holin-like toxin [Cytobacillus praedii]|uniref:putative holin-like toxin n=1 Tax=Cytobacillus praedii TaxID=1742358 RepID=UPI003F7E55BD